MSKKPVIRFEGYIEDWQQRGLGELVTPITRKNKDLESDVVLTISSRYGLIDQYEFFNKRIASSDVSGYYLMEKGEFAYNKSTSGEAPCGSVKRLDRYDKGVLSTLYIIFMLSKEEIIDSDFLTEFYDTALWHNDIRAIATVGARNHGLLNISPSDFFTTNVSFPPAIEEQKLIADYFKQLDALITLHQSNYEKMVATKKSMLDKLFPQSDAKVPAIRFEGFVGDWEKKPLGAIVIPYSDPVEVPHDGYERLGIRSHGKGVFHEYVEAGKEITTAQLHRVAAHNFIVNITFAWEHAVAVTCDNDAGKLVSHRFPQFSMADGIHDQFLKYLILDARFRHHLLLSSPGGAGRNRVLKISEMLEYEMMIPDIEEQKQIAGYLNSLDELIELYRIRIEKLKNIKAACLQGMFV